MINLSLIRPDNPLPVIQSPILVSIGKIEVSLVMLGREKGVFGLDYSFHASFF